jgi:hypothetical protein
MGHQSAILPPSLSSADRPALIYISLTAELTQPSSSLAVLDSFRNLLNLSTTLPSAAPLRL